MVVRRLEVDGTLHAATMVFTFEDQSGALHTIVAQQDPRWKLDNNLQVSQTMRTGFPGGYTDADELEKIYEDEQEKKSHQKRMELAKEKFPDDKLSQQKLTGAIREFLEETNIDVTDYINVDASQLTLMKTITNAPKAHSKHKPTETSVFHCHAGQLSEEKIAELKKQLTPQDDTLTVACINTRAVTPPKTEGEDYIIHNYLSARKMRQGWVPVPYKDWFNFTEEQIADFNENHPGWKERRDQRKAAYEKVNTDRHHYPLQGLSHAELVKNDVPLLAKNGDILSELCEKMGKPLTNGSHAASASASKDPKIAI